MCEIGLQSPSVTQERAEASIEHSVLRALAYADVFDHPLTATEVHRYLVGAEAPLERVRTVLRSMMSERIVHRDGLYMLLGRDQLVETRRRRAASAARLWPHALRYGRMLARLPFVRMVAITGALARDNVEAGSDVDYLLVTAPGRVWVTRGLTGVVRRAVHLRGIRLCPNYVLSERALELEDRNLFTATELAQMVPIAGYGVYRGMREANGWTAEFLPNASGCPRLPIQATPGQGLPTRVAEAVLATPIGSWLERLEWARVERKLPARTAHPLEVVYTAECFKDHVDNWGARILNAYAERISAAGADP